MCTAEYFYVYYDVFNGLDTSQHAHDFCCCECGEWNVDMEEMQSHVGLKTFCEECGHVFCHLCEWEGEENRVLEWWDEVDY